ncbi:MAG: GspH/FimT family pseudopilin [Desulfobacteria bacterium]|jgi:prepilin-type N-terminal cleavage/methylation domain-containing protein
MRIRLRDKKGFTMIELLIVVAIIGITAAVASPYIIDWIPTMRVNSAARDLVSEMQLARMKAVSERNDYVITFDTTTNQYSIYDDNDSNFSTSNVLVKTVNLPSGIQFGYIAGKDPSNEDITGSVQFGATSSPIRETFIPNGTANLMGSVYLIPTEDIAGSRRDRQRAITVIQTGRVKLWKYDSSSNPPWK